MNIYRIKVKDLGVYEYGKYRKFIVIGKSINDMLENLYNELFPDKEEIPYYLRSSNFEITCLGEFIPSEKVKLDNILCSDYINED